MQKKITLKSRQLCPHRLMVRTVDSQSTNQSSTLCASTIYRFITTTQLAKGNALLAYVKLSALTGRADARRITPVYIPVTQSGQSRGLLIRWSWVQIPSGVPIMRMFVLVQRSNSFMNWFSLKSQELARPQNLYEQLVFKKQRPLDKMSLNIERAQFSGRTLHF